MSSELDRQLKFMVEKFISTIVTSTHANFMKNLVILKDLQNNIKMINGLLKLILNGSLKKMLK